MKFCRITLEEDLGVRAAMNFVEDCKAALDDKMVDGAILTDLSIAFDCLPYAH